MTSYRNFFDAYINLIIDKEEIILANFSCPIASYYIIHNSHYIHKYLKLLNEVAWLSEVSVRTEKSEYNFANRGMCIVNV